MTTKRKKTGPPKRFTAFMRLYCTPQMKADVEAVAHDTGRSVPEVLRSYVRMGLAMETDTEPEAE